MDVFWVTENKAFKLEKCYNSLLGWETPFKKQKNKTKNH